MRFTMVLRDRSARFIRVTTEVKWRPRLRIDFLTMDEGLTDQNQQPKSLLRLGGVGFENVDQRLRLHLAKPIIWRSILIVT